MKESVKVMKTYEKIWADIVDLRNEAIMSDDDLISQVEDGDGYDDGGDW